MGMTSNYLFNFVEHYEVEQALAEVDLYDEDEEGQLNVKLSRRSKDIIEESLEYILVMKNLVDKLNAIGNPNPIFPDTIYTTLLNNKENENA